MILRDELATQSHGDEPEHGERVHERQHAVDEVDRALAAGQRGPLGRPVTTAREQSAEVLEGLLAQIRDAQPVAQQVVAVELEQGVQVEEDLEAARRHDDQRERVREGAVVGHPPDDRRHGPEHELQVGPGERDEQPLRFLREEPRIAHVAIERGVEVDEEDPDLVDLATEPLAGESVGELVDGADDDDESPGDQEPREAEVAHEGMAEFRGVGHDRRGGDGDEQKREHEKRHAEERRQRLRHPGEEPVGIEHLAAQIQQASLHSRT